MTARRVGGLAAIVLAFAVATVLALLAADVLRWQQALERGDNRFGPVAGTAGMWTPDTLLPSRISRTVTGVGDDVDYRAAVQSFRFTRPREPVSQFSQLTARSGAHRLLAAVDRADADAGRRATAANLRGALALEEARLGPASGPPLRRAVSHFRHAVELDPANQDAKFNLELALRLLASGGASSGGGGGERTSTPASGAGAASAGSGY